MVAIKQTLYRTSDESPIVAALMHAAEQGKQVAVLVEVKARFDEANNIEWAQRLENVGVHVTYGVMGLKTHSKATLVVREEPGGFRSYCHIGTGNYHPKTARLYTDLGLFTCSPDLGYDIVNLFHSLTGYSPDQRYRQAIVAPQAMRSTFVRLIQQEIDYQQRHGNGRIIAKMNALDDVRIIQELYQASQAGVQIDLIVRGHCRLRPGLPGFSDNIRVISILGRFLEHDRIFYFHNNGDAPHLHRQRGLARAQPGRARRADRTHGGAGTAAAADRHPARCAGRQSSGVGPGQRRALRAALAGAGTSRCAISTRR